MNTRQVFDHIRKWDFSIEKQYMIEKELYSKKEVNTVEVEFKKWLAISISVDDGIVPISDKIDIFWHTIILFTQNYVKFSQYVLGKGRYIHHRPAILDDSNELNKAFLEKTLLIYRKNFGEPNSDYWNFSICTQGCGEVSCRAVFA